MKLSHCVFVNNYENNESIIPFLYVNDIFIVEKKKNKKMIYEIKFVLNKSSVMKATSAMNKILGTNIIIYCSKRMLWMSQGTM